MQPGEEVGQAGQADGAYEGENSADQQEEGDERFENG